MIEDGGIVAFALMAATKQIGEEEADEVGQCDGEDDGQFPIGVEGKEGTDLGRGCEAADEEADGDELDQRSQDRRHSIFRQPGGKDTHHKQVNDEDVTGHSPTLGSPSLRWNYNSEAGLYSVLRQVAVAVFEDRSVVFRLRKRLGWGMEKRFENQVAIVTGGAAGIGKAIVQRLAREGACVTLFDLDAERSVDTLCELETEGLIAEAHLADITRESEVEAGIGDVCQRHGGRLDVLVHCAGIVGPTSTNVVDVSVKDFDRVTAVNVRGTFLMTKHALKVMQPRNYGRILHFASIAGKEGNAGMHAYSASKAAVIGLVKSVGKEYAESGITINAIAPAVIRTPMVDAIDDAQMKYMTDKIPMKRCGTLEEVAALSCWIVSPEASFNTGFTFDLTGGRAVY